MKRNICNGFEKEKSQKVSLEFKRAFSSEQDMHEQVGR